MRLRSGFKTVAKANKKLRKAKAPPQIAQQSVKNVSFDLEPQEEESSDEMRLRFCKNLRKFLEFIPKYDPFYEDFKMTIYEIFQGQNPFLSLCPLSDEWIEDHFFLDF